jgi:hypothetical protein
MADNTCLSNWDQHNTARSARKLTSLAGQLLRTVEELKKAKDQHLALGLNALYAANANGDRIHKDGDAPTKQEMLDLSALVDYCRKNILNDGTTNSNTAAQAKAILDRYAAE